MSAAEDRPPDPSLGGGAALVGMRPPQPQRRRLFWFAPLVVVVMTGAVFVPTLRNGFLRLAFDDDLLLLSNPQIRALDGASIWAMVTESVGSNYIPLTTFTFALHYRLWGFEPFGYHLVNVCLHAITALLVWLFAWRLTSSIWISLLAALIFAVHPLQLEAVAVPVQRKTLLAAAFFFSSLAAYQQWRRDDRLHWYVAAFFAFILAAASKPSVITLPLILLLYDYAFVDSRLRLRDKLPFFLVSVSFALLALGAAQDEDVVKAPFGGTWLTHFLVLGRMTMEYGAALFLPIALSPIYYYRYGIEYSFLTIASFTAVAFLFIAVTLRRHRYPWSFFCLWWFVLALLPQSNLIPTNQLRPDRYVYVSLFGFGLWIAVGLEQLRGLTTAGLPWRLGSRVIGITFVIFLASVTFASAPIWRNDVTAWTRVAERHPWCGMAHHFLGLAFDQSRQPANAEMAFRRAIRLDPTLTHVHLQLAVLYYTYGAREKAKAEAQLYLPHAPPDDAGRKWLEERLSDSQTTRQAVTRGE